jgi:hypothetical protein
LRRSITSGHPVATAHKSKGLSLKKGKALCLYPVNLSSNGVALVLLCCYEFDALCFPAGDLIVVPHGALLADHFNGLCLGFIGRTGPIFERAGLATFDAFVFQSFRCHEIPPLPAPLLGYWATVRFAGTTITIAGGRGFEPRPSDSESPVLPLNYPPTGDRDFFVLYWRVLYHQKSCFARGRVG